MLRKIVLLFVLCELILGNNAGANTISRPDHLPKLSRQNRNTVQCGPTDTGLFPHPTDCTKFLNCDGGRTFIQDCGAGTAFHPNGYCDYPYNVQCPPSPRQPTQRQPSPYVPPATTKSPSQIYQPTWNTINNDYSAKPNRNCGLNGSNSGRVYKC